MISARPLIRMNLRSELDVDVSGKVALITGGGTGVGRATGLALARLGCSVAINYSRSRESAEETVAAISSLGVRAIAVRADVSDDQQCVDMVRETVEQLGGLDVLVCSAGTTEFIPHHDLAAVTSETWDKLFGVNLKGPFQVARAAYPHLKKVRGEIISVSSIAGITGNGSSIPYCTSKAALNTLTISLARVMAPEVRVNAVAPGFITGRWLEEGLGEQYESVKQAFEQAVPLQQVCTPEDVAACLVSIITGADLVTGQVIVCDGGMTIQGPQVTVAEPGQ
ncbi:MAG: 3-oxoacyl-[acyl-carrier protein] reductase [Pirellulaceae bacterium]|jgi:3-oxoacyl-[acyl-carrier protein] reductase